MTEAEVYIGDNVFIGPHVCIVTIEHPLDAEERAVHQMPHSVVSGSRGNMERAKPIHIGNNVLIYSNTVVCPGVTIGDNTIIGAGSVVTKDIPANVFACGVPCRIMKQQRLIHQLTKAAVVAESIISTTAVFIFCVCN